MNSGYLGSLIVHGVVIAIGLAAASLVRMDRDEEPMAPPPIVELTPSGGDSGGSVGPGAPAPKRPPTLVRVDVLDSAEFLAQWRANQAATAPATATAPVRPVSTSAVRPVAPTPRAPVSGGTPAGPRRPLVAPTVDGGTSSPGTAGSANTPAAPGPGAGSSADFAASVRAVFAESFVPLFRERGAGISSDNDSGEVKLRVSPAGNVTFAGWGVRPAEALLEEIVLHSVATMHPVPPPPGGVETVVCIRFSGTVE